jgi:hypothetical protein
MTSDGVAGGVTVPYGLGTSSQLAIVKTAKASVISLAIFFISFSFLLFVG